MADLFKNLESNDLKVFNDTKHRFFEQFNSVREPWLVNGVYDYYLQSSSTRAMEILVNITEQHFTFLCDKLIEGIKSSKCYAKMQALTLLGFIVRKEPTWLIKITSPQNNLIKELLKLLKNEIDVLPLLSALLVVIILLPIYPAWIGQNHLKDLLEIFSRLAAFNISNPGKVSEEQMVHMQMTLFSLFQRLYGMYPCNFISFLRTYYRNKETSPIFMHTIRPMITTVKMHPLLISYSTEYELSNERWKKMVPYDVILECERYNIKTGERCSNDSCVFATTTSFRARAGTNPPNSFEKSEIQVLRGTQMQTINSENNFFSPSMLFEVQPVVETPVATNIPQGTGQGLGAVGAYLSQEGTSPPEAAIEATPETTPIRDLRMTARHLPPSSVARALTTFSSPKSRASTSGIATPNTSQPSSPMRKEPSPFSFPIEARHGSAFGYPKKDAYTTQKLQKMIQDRVGVQQATEGMDKRLPNLPPSSPLRIIPPGANMIVPGSPMLPVQRNESPVSQEDEEVLKIVDQSDQIRNAAQRQCDSVVHDMEGRVTEADLDNCEQEHGSPCTAGGLHMPNSRSMSEFAKQVSRLRYNSQCAAETEKFYEQSTESSPGKSSSLPTSIVRRAHSCPEIKKTVVPVKDNIGKPLPETAEEGVSVNGIDEIGRKSDEPRMINREAQTDVLFPMPYEHLFLSIFPSMGNSQTEMTAASTQAESLIPDGFDVLDRYMTVAINNTDRESVKNLKGHLHLLHQRLLFERYQREIATYRNRRLLTEAKSTKTLEEYNSALRDQIQIQQKEIESLRQQEVQSKYDRELMEKERAKIVENLENEVKQLQEEIRHKTQRNNNLNLDLEHAIKQREAINKTMQNIEHRMIDAEATIQIAHEQVLASERGREELDVVNRELLLARELQSRYQERLDDLPLLKSTEEELRRLVTTYNSELKALQTQFDLKSAMLESYKLRTSELEATVSQYEEEFVNQKRLECEIKEQHDEKLKAIEGKYKAMVVMNRELEGKILDLWQKVEVSSQRSLHSPDISSCQEVNTVSASGLSPSSTPLSASLVSSDGALINVDVRNLQCLGNRHREQEDVPEVNVPGASYLSLKSD